MLVAYPVHHHADATVPDGKYDRDVDIAGGAIFTKDGSLDQWVVSTAWSFVHSVSWLASGPTSSSTVTPRLSFRPYIRPPLRGPPG
jgi:hypothetical protein